MNDTTMELSTREASSFGVIAAPQTVRIERLLPGPIERVWTYLIDPDKRKSWFADGPIEAKVGGSVDLIWRNSTLSNGDEPPSPNFGDENGESRGRGVVTAYEPPRRLGITWAHPGDPETEAVFDLSPRGDRVVLVITHRRLVTDGLVVGVSAGWHTHIEILEARLSDREPPRFWATFGELRGTYRERYGL